eukprot:3026569-Lingulodinium_polyedra.AAC.1
MPAARMNRYGMPAARMNSTGIPSSTTMDPLRADAAASVRSPIHCISLNAWVGGSPGAFASSAAASS